MGEGVKHDRGKARWTLMPWRPLTLVLDVLEYGARKYAPGNWMKVADGESRYLNSAMRHLTARLDGEVLDPESGLPHLAHVGCNVLFALAFERGLVVVEGKDGAT